MKKKLFLAIVMTAVLAMLLAFAVSADSVHNENTVDYSATVTLDDGAVCNLFDSEGNALIWYISGTDAEGKNVYSSIRADDPQVKYESGNYSVQAPDCNGTKINGYEVKNFKMIFGGKEYDINKVVVFNIMDDDVTTNFGVNENFSGKPITCLKDFLSGRKNLEYVYLRLDTIAIMRNMFNGCTKLKYINLEDLTQLVEIGDGGNFSGCSSLFDNQMLDLSKTQLASFDLGSGAFKGVPIKGIKLPDTLIDLGSGTFQNCTKLETISLTKREGKTMKVGSNVFDGCTSLKAICYVGTEEDFSTLKINETGNSQFANTISYADYKALSDTDKNSKVYAVYNYSKCEAYNNGVHGETTEINACLGTCVLCGDTVVNHTETENLTVTIEYSNYTEAGTKTTACQNEGCGYNETVEVPALFINLGYSAAEYGNAMSINYRVNEGAIAEYEEITGVKINYGVFAVLADNIGDKELFDENGVAQSGVIAADITDSGFTLFSLKIVGFTEEQKETDLAMGAYVGTTKDGATEYSYLQIAEPVSGKYFFASYNDVLAILQSKEKVA